MKNAFSNLHPFVNLIFFVIAIGFTMFVMNPICLLLGFFSALATALLLNGKKAVRLTFMYLLPMILLIVLINPVFNHRGVTILTYFPWDNPLTLESIIYGAASAVMLSTVILWFSCFNTVMTSDKIVYLFGRIAPSLSLVVSMALRFVPRFTSRLKEVRMSRRAVGKDINEGGIICRLKNAVKIFSIMLTWSLESSIETADSMRSRGHGLKGRTAFSLYRFDKRDGSFTAFILALGAALAVLLNLNAVKFGYYPSISGDLLSPQGMTFYILYAALLLIPIFMSVGEGLKWKHIQSKI